MVARSDELRKEVGGHTDPPSLAYFAKVAELEQWLSGDEAKRSRLEKRWRRRYVDRQKQQRAARLSGGA